MYSYMFQSPSEPTHLPAYEDLEKLRPVFENSVRTFLTSENLASYEKTESLEPTTYLPILSRLSMPHIYSLSLADRSGIIRTLMEIQARTPSNVVPGGIDYRETLETLLVETWLETTSQQRYNTAASSDPSLDTQHYDLSPPKIPVTELFGNLLSRDQINGWELRGTDLVTQWPRTNTRQELLASLASDGSYAQAHPLHDQPIRLTPDVMAFFKDLPKADRDNVDGSEIAYHYRFYPESVLPWEKGTSETPISFFLKRKLPQDLAPQSQGISQNSPSKSSTARTEFSYQSMYRAYSRGMASLETDPVRARTYFKKASELGHGGAYFELGKMLLDGIGGPSDSVLGRKYIEIAGTEYKVADALSSMVIESYSDGDWELAKRITQSVLDENPSSYFQFSMGKILESEGAFEQAEKLYRQALTTPDSNYPDFLHRFGLFLRFQGRLDESERNEYLALNKNFNPAGSFLGEIYALKGDHERAKVTWEASYETYKKLVDSTSDIEIYLIASRLAFYLNRAVEAEEWLERAEDALDKAPALPLVFIAVKAQIWAQWLNLGQMDLADTSYSELLYALHGVLTKYPGLENRTIALNSGLLKLGEIRDSREKLEDDFKSFYQSVKPDL